MYKSIFKEYSAKNQEERTYMLDKFDEIEEILVEEGIDKNIIVGEYSGYKQFHYWLEDYILPTKNKKLLIKNFKYQDAIIKFNDTKEGTEMFIEYN